MTYDSSSDLIWYDTILRRPILLFLGSFKGQTQIRSNARGNHLPPDFGSPFAERLAHLFVGSFLLNLFPPKPTLVGILDPPDEATPLGLDEFHNPGRHLWFFASFARKVLGLPGIDQILKASIAFVPRHRRASSTDNVVRTQRPDHICVVGREQCWVVVVVVVVAAVIISFVTCVCLCYLGGRTFARWRRSYLSGWSLFELWLGNDTLLVFPQVCLYRHMFVAFVVGELSWWTWLISIGGIAIFVRVMLMVIVVLRGRPWCGRGVVVFVFVVFLVVAVSPVVVALRRWGSMVAPLLAMIAVGIRTIRREPSVV